MNRQICLSNKKTCLGYKDGECVSIENCMYKSDGDKYSELNLGKISSIIRNNKSYSAEFNKLLTDNPNSPIIIFGLSDDDKYCRDISFGIYETLNCEVPYMKYVEKDRVNFEEQIEKWLWNEMGGNNKDSKLSKAVFEDALKETKAKYEPYWKKAIAIYVDN